MTTGSDAHYLARDDRWIHKSYLNSKGGEREVDSFYEYAHLMTEETARGLLSHSYTDEEIDWIFAGSEDINSKISFYSLEKHQTIPEVKVDDYQKRVSYWFPAADISYPTLRYLCESDNIQERYWVNKCLEKLVELDCMNKKYLERLEEEARVKKLIGEKLETCMFAYPNTLQHYIDLFWECGSTVGAGRGSACSGLNHYLLGITQLDPIEWDLPFWRLNV